MDLQKNIEKAWIDRELIHTDTKTQRSIEEVIEKLDKGELKAAEKHDDEWRINEWVKKSILLYFVLKKSKNIDLGGIRYSDKIDVKTKFENTIRAVPNTIVRYGSFINQDVVLMPSYINIGCFIDSGTMIDIGVGIGSCAQIGKNVHLSAGTIIGGVLEPLKATPVIIEDNVFIGANATIVEGILVKENAVIAANVTITASTKIINTETNVIHKGLVPKDSVVIPGSYTKKFGSHEYNISCALIIGKRTKNTDAKVALNEILRN